MQKKNYDANVLCRDENAKFIHVDASAHSNHDVNVSLQRWRCKCLLMGMSWCKYLLVGMPWCKCFDANTSYLKIPFVFKSRLPQGLKPKYFQNLIYYSWKVIFFTEGSPKKLVIIVRKSPNGALTWNLMIWLERFIFTIWLSKRVTRFQGHFLEKWILWKLSILERFIF